MQIILPGLYIGISSIAYIDNTAVYVFTYCSLLLDRSRYLRVHVGNFVNALANSIKGTVAKLAMRQPFVLFKGLTFQKLCLPGA
ncbi:hypothetical protein M2T74_29365, partial [Klebsiella pneumoniae]|nr:hypothetical protein [Klebsiella pneumoniae]